MFLNTPARIANNTVSIIVSCEIANNDTRKDSDKFELFGSIRLATVTEALRLEKYEQSTQMTTSIRCKSDSCLTGFANALAITKSTAVADTVATTIF